MIKILGTEDFTQNGDLQPVLSSQAVPSITGKPIRALIIASPSTATTSHRTAPHKFSKFCEFYTNNIYNLKYHIS